MESRSKIKLFILLVVITPLLHFMIFPKQSRCWAAHFYGPFDRIAFGLLVSYDTPVLTRDSLLQIYQEAIERNKEFWKKIKANPKIIYCHNAQLYSKYAHAKLAATVFYRPYKVYLVLSNEAVDVDILSHEICHTELYAHLGWWKNMRQIPSWFDEGLAMQLDDRKAYSESAYIHLLDRLDYYPDVKVYTSSKQFFSGNSSDIQRNLILAKHEIYHWFNQKSILTFVQQIKAGHSFQEAYY